MQSPSAGERPDDVTDAAATPEPASEEAKLALSAVKAAWRRLKTADLPREQYGVLYRLMHGSLYVGAFLCHIGVLGPEAACCTHPGCAGELETLSHAFLLCPAVAPAADWLCRVFDAVTHHGPPANAQLLLGDSWAAWQPPPETEHLWTALRAAFLSSVWRLRCRRSLGGQPFTATAVCAAVVAAVRASIQRDWARATKDLVKLSGACPEWFRGRSPALKLSAFRARWAERGVLCTVVGGEDEDSDSEGEGASSLGEGAASQSGEGAAGAARPPPQLTLHFSLAHPVPAPAPPPVPLPVQSTQSPQQQHSVDPG